jgi:hypothetical protein
MTGVISLSHINKPTWREIMPRQIDNDTTIEQIVPLRDLKAGAFFRRKPDAAKVYVRGEYLPGEKKFSCTDYGDMNREIFLVGTTQVFVGFCF